MNLSLSQGFSRVSSGCSNASADYMDVDGLTVTIRSRLQSSPVQKDSGRLCCSEGPDGVSEADTDVPVSVLSPPPAVVCSEESPYLLRTTIIFFECQTRHE